MFASRSMRMPAMSTGARPVRRNVAASVTADRAALDITKISEGGILMTGVVSSSAQAAQIGEVLAIGDKVESDKFSVKKGDTILYSKYGTSDVEAAKGSRVVFVGKDSILGVCV